LSDVQTRPRTEFENTVLNRVVTVVIPCFNHGSWLGEAIASVRAQVYGPIETIVVDDGSTDKTAAVSAAHPEVRYIWQSNQGLSAARNAGLAAATGNFVCFLDADDVLRPDAIARGVEALEANESWAFVYGGHVGVKADRTLIWETRVDPGQASYHALLRANFIAMHATVLYRREILQKAGGFDVKLRAAEDYEVYLRLARSHPFGCHGGVIAEYRRHDDNMSSDPMRMLTAGLSVLRAQMPFIKHSHEGKLALQEGTALLQKYYGGPMVTQALRDLSIPQRRTNAVKCLGLAWQLAPRAFASALWDGTLRIAYAAEQRLPGGLRRLIRKASGRTPPVPTLGRVKFGDLRRTSPIDPDFGFGRGIPIDRYYIEQFLSQHGNTIAGRVMEIGDNCYTMRFGGMKVMQSDVLHVKADAPGATIVGDLENADHIPCNSFDCIVLTQTLHLIFDMPRAVATLHRILKPGGTLLLTVPGLSQIDRGEWGETWYWSLTASAVRRLLVKGWSDVSVDTYGNVLSAVSFLQGLAATELTSEELATQDPAYQVIVAARAVKGAEGSNG
jgi:hypothetical protein